MIFIPNFNQCYFPQGIEQDFVQLRGSSHSFSVVSYPGICSMEDCIKKLITNTKEFRHNGGSRTHKRGEVRKETGGYFYGCPEKSRKNRHHITCYALF